MKQSQKNIATTKSITNVQYTNNIAEHINITPLITYPIIDTGEQNLVPQCGHLTPNSKNQRTASFLIFSYIACILL